MVSGKTRFLTIKLHKQKLLHAVVSMIRIQVNYQSSAHQLPFGAITNTMEEDHTGLKLRLSAASNSELLIPISNLNAETQLVKLVSSQHLFPQPLERTSRHTKLSWQVTHSRTLLLLELSAQVNTILFKEISSKDQFASALAHSNNFTTKTKSWWYEEKPP